MTIHIGVDQLVRHAVVFVAVGDHIDDAGREDAGHTGDLVVYLIADTVGNGSQLAGGTGHFPLHNRLLRQHIKQLIVDAVVICAFVVDVADQQIGASNTTPVVKKDLIRLFRKGQKVIAAHRCKLTA